MVDILHRVGIAATPHEVYESLATIDGLASWWTRDVSGDPSPGGQIEFSFGSPDRTVAMEVVSTRPDERVTWRCSSGPDEWIGTTVTFDLKALPDETVVRFEHGGWREPVEFMSHCSTKWAYFLLGMKAGFEGGKAPRFPDDEKISRWG
jgi:uncharacterized protein YndB with AHSA1/START domain